MKNLETDKRIRKTKLAFHKALHQLLLEKDLRNITVKELCELADVNRGTFYAHYTDIHDIIMEMEQEMSEKLRVLFEDIPSDTPPSEIFLNHLHEGVLCFTTDKSLCQTLLSKYHVPDNNMRMSKLTKQYFLSFLSDKDEKTKTLYQSTYCYIFQGTMGVLKQWAADGMKISPEEIADMVTRLARQTLMLLED